MSLLLWTIVFIVSLVVLIKAADYFITIGSKIGLLFNLPPFIIGITIIALGTSAPELVTSILAFLAQQTEFIPATIVGSNISNILLIVGASALIVKHITSKWDLIRVDIPILAATTALLIFVLADGVVERPEALFLIAGYAIYILYFTSIHKQQKLVTKKPQPSLLLFLGLAGCIAAIYFSAEYTLKSVIALSALFGLPDTSFIGISAVAIATSLPELIVSIKAIRRHNIELAFGNILGSNVVNATLVLGLPVLFGPIMVSPMVLSVGVPFLIGAVALYAVALLDRKITKYEGLYFLLLYGVFIYSLFRFLG
jgi:cation:H+ antiporter